MCLRASAVKYVQRGRVSVDSNEQERSRLRLAPGKIKWCEWIKREQWMSFGKTRKTPAGRLLWYRWVHDTRESCDDFTGGTCEDVPSRWRWCHRREWQLIARQKWAHVQGRPLRWKGGSWRTADVLSKGGECRDQDDMRRCPRRADRETTISDATKVVAFEKASVRARLPAGAGAPLAPHAEGWRDGSTTKARRAELQLPRGRRWSAMGRAAFTTVMDYGLRRRKRKPATGTGSAACGLTAVKTGSVDMNEFSVIVCCEWEAVVPPRAAWAARRSQA